jgi:hypothetical protein
LIANRIAVELGQYGLLFRRHGKSTKPLAIQTRMLVASGTTLDSPPHNSIVFREIWGADVSGSQVDFGCTHRDLLGVDSVLAPLR